MPTRVRDTFLCVSPPRSPRERTEELERASLSAWATLSVDTKGRERLEPDDRLRTAFQIDRDRVLSCASFERLNGKSHAVLGSRDEANRSRLNHTLRTTRIARTLSRALRLNEDLAEAIAVACDLGATAFGRAGTDALSLFTDSAFLHNHQSVRVAETLERNGDGLNLTWEVRDGVACHTVTAATPATREGEVVRISNRIAALTALTLDGLACGAISATEMPDDVVADWGSNPHNWAGILLADAVGASTDSPDIRLTEATWARLDRASAFAADRIGAIEGVVTEQARGSHCLSSLVVFYLDHPGRLPASFRAVEDHTLTWVVDFVSSLSDSRALQLFDELFLPHTVADRP